MIKGDNIVKQWVLHNMEEIRRGFSYFLAVSVYTKLWWLICAIFNLLPFRYFGAKRRQDNKTIISEFLHRNNAGKKGWQDEKLKWQNLLEKTTNRTR